MTFDFDLNLATIISILTALSTAVGFIWSIKSGQKVQSAQYQALKVDLDDVKGQLGELRRLHLQVAAQSDAHDKTIKEVVKTTESNKEQITKNTKIIKVQLPKVLATVEQLKKDN